MIVGIIGTIIFGAIVGILARLVLPGKQNISTLMTVVLGILGALVGYWIWGAPKDDGSIDWLRWITSVIVAAVFVVIYERISSRRGITR
ncbi:GlsB/YeaQ/YmgE family stress response membrane protein [Nostocoides sp. Soil756]|uniref:GlsB/YeaQ/YmgE family stress response membrane protein n=1 Tax=Nostocoides sp. Soil756 TaxID=1736399 RepID=UPI0006FEF183|nr:GlsB/YeaQ/YmgE family stress response membrane protein [Tetrasphaera sp. Soil756]KRE61204.1 hypothetical protein ASG78_12760 [Tetrasphaera sp. Soil756]